MLLMKYNRLEKNAPGITWAKDIRKSEEREKPKTRPEAMNHLTK
jgi:hypothetical protein